MGAPPPREPSKAHLEACRKRGQLEERLREEGADDLAERLAKCSKKLVLVCQCCGARKEVEQRCERRWCPVCARKIAAERVARYSYAVERMQWPLFVTLTVTNSLDAWEGLRRLKAAWGRMRRLKWFRDCQVKGGITAIEITNKGRGWHPHLHSVIDCRWLAVSTPAPQRGDSPAMIATRCKQAKAELDAAWSRACRQPTASTYVKRTAQAIIAEVLKYAVDPGTLVHEEGRISDLIRAIDKYRMVQPFGHCLGIGALIKAQAAAERPPKNCESCGKDAWAPSDALAEMLSRPTKVWVPTARLRKTA